MRLDWGICLDYYTGPVQETLYFFQIRGVLVGVDEAIS